MPVASPDFLVHEDSMTTGEQEFVRSVATKGQQIQTVLQQYSLELYGGVTRDFVVTPQWRNELRRRLRAAGVTIEARYDSIAVTLLGDELAHRVARRAFGEAEAKRRTLKEDRALTRAIEMLRRSRTQQELLRTASAAALQQRAS
jgi:hypothetical protein